MARQAVLEDQQMSSNTNSQQVNSFNPPTKAS